MISDTLCRWRARLQVLALVVVTVTVAAPGLAAELKGSVLWYLEQEPGTEPYEVRYLVTEDWLRSDDGKAGGDFLLFDRDGRQIYSVVVEEHTILHIDGEGERPVAPADLSIDIGSRVDDEAPRVDGKRPLRTELRAGGELCYSALVLPGFLDGAREAFRGFAQALMVQQARTLDFTPAEYRTPCFLARYLYAADFYLQQGLPLADWDEQASRRQLLRFETDVTLDEALFRLPQGYSTEDATAP